MQINHSQFKRFDSCFKTGYGDHLSLLSFLGEIKKIKGLIVTVFNPRCAFYIDIKASNR